MRAVVQRVASARVEVEGRTVGAIGRGLLVLLGVEREDGPADLAYLAEKVCGLRVFEDEDGRMNLSVAEVDGAVLAISQFTLLGDCRKGRRPGFSQAADPAAAKALYTSFIDAVASRGIPVASGVFRASMEVHLVNSGPVTLLLDSRRRF